MLRDNLNSLIRIIILFRQFFKSFILDKKFFFIKNNLPKKYRNEHFAVINNTSNNKHSNQTKIIDIN